MEVLEQAEAGPAPKCLSARNWPFSDLRYGFRSPPLTAQAGLAATRKPQLPDELEGVLELLAATR
jgi:hypothetical protein